MPIHTVKLKDGSIGYQYGTSGKVYKDRAGALRQAQAIHASGWSEEDEAEQTSKCKKDSPKCKTAALKRFQARYAACMNKVLHG